MKYSRKLALFFSLVPGAGHMYLGLIKQGIQLMLLFFSIIFIGASFQLDFLLIFLPIVWFYSIFDVRLKSLQENIPKDDNLPIFSNVRSFDDLMKNNLMDKYIAYLLILMGILSVVNNILIPLASRYIDYEIIRYTKSCIISFILIATGCLLLRRKKYAAKAGDKLCNQDE